MVLVATEQNQVFSIEASTGALLWERIVDLPTPRNILVQAVGPCGNLDPIGITGTPVIDAATRRMYVDVATPDSDRYYRHLVYALSLDNGSTVAGWPVDVGKSVTGFRDVVQNQRGALLLLNDRLYIPYGGHAGDCSDYRGWVVGISTIDPSSIRAWQTDVLGAGIWAPSGVASDGASLFVATGNATEVVTDWSGSEAIIRLAEGPAFSGSPADYFVAPNWPALDDEDNDLGGSGVVLFDLPNRNANLLAALGKDGKMYLGARSNLGGIGGAVLTETVSDSGIITAPSVYASSSGTHVAFSVLGSGVHCSKEKNILSIVINPTSPLTTSTAWCASAPGGGSTMVTTTDGTSESIVWAVGAEGDNRLHGFDGDTGAPIAVVDGAVNVVHMMAPIAAKGRIFVAGTDWLYAFTLH